MKDLMGQHIISVDDIADRLLSANPEYFKIAIKPGTVQGFELYREDGILKEYQQCYYMVDGMYSIHKGTHCLYVGESGRSIGGRLSRWVKEINQKCRSDENHSAAKRYRSMWGNDLNGMTVRLYPCREQSCFSRKQIEKALIRKLNPLLNVRGKTA
tara:strand:- start:121 stop:588 length:468 start_codon:yes stop_codon:yes gene_type:complete